MPRKSFKEWIITKIWFAAGAAVVFVPSLIMAGEYLLAIGSTAGLVGWALNQLVVRSNGGTMPVRISELEQLKAIVSSEKHHLARASDKFLWLADVFYLGPLGIWSVGDIIEVIGAIFYLLDLYWLFGELISLMHTL